MAELTMPKMGDAMEEGTLLRWLKKEGEEFHEEEALAEIQTEKATIEVPSYVDGRLTRILVPEGQTVPVGTPIAQYEPANGATAEAPAPASPPPAEREPQPGAPRPAATTSPPPPPAARPEPPRPDSIQQPSLSGRGSPAGEASITVSSNAGSERIKATPLAKRVAADRGVNLLEVRGTGPGGRIVEADVEAASGQPAVRPEGARAPATAPTPAAGQVGAPAPGQVSPLSQMRRTIARRLTQAKQTIPHFYVTMEIDMAAAVQFREQLNALGNDRPSISFNDLIMKACAGALRKLPIVNSQFREEGIFQPEGIHIGLAVALEDGLIVPVIRDADQKSLTAIAAEAATLIERARAGKLQPAEYSGGTFSISNMGMFGVKSFIAVVNPPESAILAVGAIRQTPVVKEGQLAVGSIMDVTLSADHRAVDGAVGAQFLREVKRQLEAPLLLI